MIEDNIFNEECGVVKEDYEPVELVKTVPCSMCLEPIDGLNGYKKIDVDSSDDEYIFICSDCYNELDSKEE